MTDTERGLPLIAIANFILKAGGAGLNLLIQLLLAKVLTPDDFGIFIISFSVSTSVMVVASLGIPFSAIKYIPLYLHDKAWGLARGFFQAGIVTTITGGSGFALLAYCTSRYVISGSQETLLQALTIASISIPLLALSQTMVAFLQSLQHVIAAEFVANIIRPVVTIAGVGVILLLPKIISVTDVLWLMLLGIAASVVAGLLIFKHHVPKQLYRARSQYEARDWFSAGTSTMIIMGGVVLNERIDVMLVGAFSGVSEAGIYGICARLAFFVGFALTAVNAILGPRLSAIYATNDISRLMKVAVAGASLSVTAATLLSVCIILFDNWILGLFGPSFVTGQQTLSVLLLSQICVACFGATGAVVVLLGGYRITIIGVITALLCNIFLNVLLIPLFGPVGAAWATLAGQVIGYGMITNWCIKNSGINSTITGLFQLFR